jgi:hypothetical protein
MRLDYSVSDLILSSLHSKNLSLNVNRLNIANVGTSIPKMIIITLQNPHVIKNRDNDKAIVE